MTELPGARRYRITLVVSAIVLIVVALGSLMVGPVGIPVGTVLSDVAHHLGLGATSANSVQDEILWVARAPEIVLALLVGIMLSVAGGTYQGVFHNPLADPYLLGVASGAGLGATIAIVDAAHGASTPTYTPALAFAGALVAVSATWLLGGRGLRSSTTTLILAGVAISSLLSSAQTFLQQSSTTTATSVYHWLLGSLNNATWSQVTLVLPYVVVCTTVCVLASRSLDVMSVGDLESRTLGLPVSKVRLVVVAASSLGTAAVVSVAGLIGFVGIIVPHLIRLVVGTSYRRILPLCVLVGAAFMALADTVARTVVSPSVLPLGVVTAVIGAPVFVVVLNVSRRASR